MSYFLQRRDGRVSRRRAGRSMDSDQKIAELRKLRAQVSALEGELASQSSTRASWAPKTYYTTYHILAGLVLGLIGATASLMFNIVGSAMVGLHPLHLVRVYLTFPLGAKALEVESGFALAAGCCLYLGTGMFGGIPFHLILSRYFPKAKTIVRFMVATALGIGIWIINYYGIIAWLQPALIGGNWIVEQVPVLVAVSTHLVFAWTLLLVDQWGRFETPHATPAETAP